MMRRAYTLLEILIATTILLLGLTAVFGVMRSAQKRSVAAADLADAQLACLTAMNELLAQQSPIKPSLPKTIEGLPDWKMTVAVFPSIKPELYVLHVIAQKFDSKGEMPVGIMYQLLRWIPSYRVELTKQNDGIEGISVFDDLFLEE
jgi:prepilin-type N-terminal cleavage/methylation domain-containing protein